MSALYTHSMHHIYIIQYICVHIKCIYKLITHYFCVFESCGQVIVYAVLCITIHHNFPYNDLDLEKGISQSLHLQCQLASLGIMAMRL